MGFDISFDVSPNISLKKSEVPVICEAMVVTLMGGHQIDGLVQERCNSIANALELRLSCTNPLKSSLA